MCPLSLSVLKGQMVTVCTTCQRGSMSGAQIGTIPPTMQSHRIETQKARNMEVGVWRAVGRGGIAFDLLAVEHEVVSPRGNILATSGFAVQ